MIRCWLATLVALVVVALNIGTADARQVFSNGELIAKTIVQARSAWPQSPCLGRETIVFDNAEMMRWVPLSEMLAVAVPERCRVVISDRAWTLEAFCHVLTHELGHLAGYGHQPRNAWTRTNPLVTLAPDDDSWDGCVIARDDYVLEAMRGLFPGKRWGCGRWTRGGVLRCKVRLKGKRVRKIVFFDNNDGMGWEIP